MTRLDQAYAKLGKHHFMGEPQDSRDDYLQWCAERDKLIEEVFFASLEEEGLMPETNYDLQIQEMEIF